MKKLVSAILSLVLLIGCLTIPACATELKSFSDVPSTYWAHDYIMSMVEKGLFAGTTSPDKNGVGTFSPDSPMTRAQFITVVTRYLYADELNGMTGKTSVWFENNYNVALNHGLLKNGEFEISEMSVAMTREEMAMVLARACELLGEDISKVIEDSRIPDFNSINTYYRSYVKVAYTKGLIAGTDSKGTFNPKGTLTRAQAATVLYRLVEPTTRNIIEVEVPTTGSSWIEGQAHSKDAVKAGATVIKADGTKVVLKETKVGNMSILGFGQGVDPYSGIVLSSGHVIVEGNNSWYDSSPFIKDPVTGEMHSTKEWQEIKSFMLPSTVGTYEGEVRNTWFKWSNEMGRWFWNGPNTF